MNALRSTEPDVATIEQAAHWAAVLATEEASEAERAACEAWCRAHPLHRLAFERMRSFDAAIDRTSPVERETVRAVLGRRGRRRRRAASVAVAILLSAGAGWTLTQSFAARGLFADYRTARGEQRTVALADGSRLTIDTDAALDTHLDRRRRTVTLFRGQVMASVQRDARPFVVETPEGAATAMGTVFSARRQAAATTITVLESRVRACAARTGDCLELAAGERARLDGSTVVRLPDVDPATAGSWAQGWLTVDDQPVAEVLAELNRYRRSAIAFDAAGLQGRRVSGSFPLADTDRAASAIARVARLRLSRSADGAMTLHPPK